MTTTARPFFCYMQSGLVIGAMLPVAASAQRLGGGEAVAVAPVRVLLSLVLCIIIAGLAALLIRQRGGAGDLRRFAERLTPRTRTIDVIETRRLSVHADLSLIRHGDREYLLLVQQGGAQVLRERTIEPAEVAACENAS